MANLVIGYAWVWLHILSVKVQDWTQLFERSPIASGNFGTFSGFGDSSLTLDWMIHRLQLAIAFDSQFETSWEQRHQYGASCPVNILPVMVIHFCNFYGTPVPSVPSGMQLFSPLCQRWGENHSWHAIRLQWVHVLAKTSLRDLRHCCEDLCLCAPRCKDPDQYPPLQPAALSALNERVKWWFLCAMSNAIITHHLRLTVESVRDIHMKGGSILKARSLGVCMKPLKAAVWLRLSVSFLWSKWGWSWWHGRSWQDPWPVEVSLISMAKRFDNVPPHNSEVAEARDQHARHFALCGCIQMF